MCVTVQYALLLQLSKIPNCSFYMEDCSIFAGTHCEQNCYDLGGFMTRSHTLVQRRIIIIYLVQRRIIIMYESVKLFCCINVLF